jgi:hypothetical protein
VKFLRALETQAHSLIKTQEEARIEGELVILARLVPTMATWNMLTSHNHDKIHKNNNQNTSTTNSEQTLMNPNSK